MSDQQKTASKSSNIAEYAVVACMFAGLGGALWYGMSVSSPEKAKEPPQVAAPAADVKAVAVSAKPGEFTPPGEKDYPEGPAGEWVRRGEAIFTRTPANAVGYSGNPLSCTNCHLDAGRLKGAAPMWGAYPMYPAYRKKTEHMDTFAERVRGCFMYSMNGKAPEDGHEILVALESYAYWMAQKAPTGEKLPGAGFKKAAQPEQTPTYEAGAKVYEAKCALCHGSDGKGQFVGDIAVFPPLWGKDSYNWGAGMHEIDKAANFIKNNMPYGNATLTDQEAWDVSTFINSQERGQDPRFNGDLKATAEKYHAGKYTLYGKEVNGKVLKGL